MWPTVIAGGLLGYLAWRVREPTANLALAAGGPGIIRHYDFNLMLVLPASRLGLGILLVVAGFLALMAGVWVNYWLCSTTNEMNHDEGDNTVPVKITRQNIRWLA